MIKPMVVCFCSIGEGQGGGGAAWVGAVATLGDGGIWKKP